MDKQNIAKVNEILNALTKHKASRFKKFAIFSLYWLLGGFCAIILTIVLHETLPDFVFNVINGAYATVLATCFYIGIYLLIIWNSRYRSVKRHIVRILQTDGTSGFEKLAVETEQYINRKVPFLGERYFYFPKRGLLLKYSELAWIYVKHEITQTNYGIFGTDVTSNTYLILCTIYGQSVDLKMAYEDVSVMAAKNPALMVGYTEENIRKYRDIVKMNSDAVK
jgi:hypothetical protein